MNLKRISKKAIAEEYALFNDVASIFRLRMSDNWILRFKDLIDKKTVKHQLNSSNFEDTLKEALTILRSLQSFNAVKDLENQFLLIELVNNYLIYQNERVLNNEISAARLKVIDIQIRKHLVNFLGNGNKNIGFLTIVNEIDVSQFNEYHVFRLKHDKKVSSVTIKNELNCFKNFFSWCNTYYFMNSKNFNFSIKIKTSKNKRKGITPLEFFRIQAALKKWPDSSSSSKDSYYKKVIRDFIFIQSSFLLSFSELKKLKWDDVSLLVKDQELNAKLTIDNGKSKRIVSSREGHFLFHIKTYSKAIEKHNYVFSKFLKDEMIDNNTYYFYFNKIMSELKIDKTNRNIGFDDFKTMGIILKIKNGLSLFEIAEITGENYINLYKKFNDIDLKEVINKTFN